MFLIEMVRKLMFQVRICPSCGHRQAKQAHHDKRGESCEKCGASLPPARDRDATGKS